MGVKGVWKQSVCLRTAGSSGCSLEFPIQTVLGVVLTTPKIKNTSVYNLLLGCFLLMLVSGPAVGIHALVCVGGTKLEILRNCSLPPPNRLNFWRIDWKGPHRRHGQELPASHTGCTHGFRHLWNLETCAFLSGYHSFIFRWIWT